MWISLLKILDIEKNVFWGAGSSKRNAGFFTLTTIKGGIMRTFCFLLLIVSVCVSGCATIVTGVDQKMSFNSEPDGATVLVSGKAVGKTPLTVEIDKGKNQALVFEKEGYKTFTTQLSTTLNSWFWGNILIGGLLGSTTDGVSGAIYEFSPNQYFVTLTPDSSLGISTSKPRKIKELIIAFGPDVRMEMANGQGENLEAIMEVLEVKQEDRETTLKVLQKFSSENESDLDLANKIIEFYNIK